MLAGRKNEQLRLFMLKIIVKQKWVSVGQEYQVCQDVGEQETLERENDENSNAKQPKSAVEFLSKIESKEKSQRWWNASQILLSSWLLQNYGNLQRNVFSI